MFRIVLIVALIALSLWVALEVRSPLDVISFLFYPTLVFVPVAIFVLKFKKHITNRNKSYASFGITGFFLGNIIAKSVSPDFRIYLMIFFAELMMLLYYVFLREYKERDQLSGMNFKSITGKEFKNLTKNAGIKSFRTWFGLATRDHYKGEYQGIETCIFSFQTNGPSYLAVIMQSRRWQLPVIQIKKKSFYQHFRSMIKSEKDNTGNLGLSEDYHIDIAKDNTNARFPAEIIAEINKRESVVLELTPTALFLYDEKKFTDEPENYQPAIQEAYLLASLAVGNEVAST